MHFYFQGTRLLEKEDVKFNTGIQTMSPYLTCLLPLLKYQHSFRKPQLIDTDIEIYLARSLGFSLTVLGVIVLFFMGTIPLSSSIAAAPIVSLDDTTDPKAPYAVPILLVTTLYQGFTAVYCYMRYVNISQTGFLLGCAGYGGLACMGMVSLLVFPSFKKNIFP
jgi:hypothetical protein